MSLLTNLVGAWKLDGNSNDAFGSNNGVDTNMSYSAGKINLAGDFGGVNSQVVFADMFASTNVTVSFWVKANAYAAGQSRPIYRTGFYMVEYGGAGLFDIDVNMTGTHPSNIALTLGVWKHVVITFDSGGTVNVYGNGVLTSTFGYSGTLLGSPYTSIGSYNGGDYFNGSMDDFNVWNRVLTLPEITDLYNGGAGLTYPFLPPHKPKFFKFFQ